MQLLYNLNFSSSIIKVKYALESINEAIDPLNEVKLERSRIQYTNTGVSCLQTLQGVCAYQRLKAKLVSWSATATTLSIEAFFILCIVLFCLYITGVLYSIQCDFRWDFWLSVFNFAALLWIISNANLHTNRDV